jgi:hypothetical protein
MNPMQLTDEELQATIAATEGKTQREAADELGIDVRTLQRRLVAAARRGLTEHIVGGAMPPGYTAGKITMLRRDEGNVLQWVHAHPDAPDPEEVLTRIADVMNSSVKPLELIPSPAFFLDERAMVYLDADTHLGM